MTHMCASEYRQDTESSEKKGGEETQGKETEEKKTEQPTLSVVRGAGLELSHRPQGKKTSRLLEARLLGS